MLAVRARVTTSTGSGLASPERKQRTAADNSGNWSVYIIECADGRLYTGISTDVARRFREHSEGGVRAARALRGKGPLKLVFQQRVGTRGEASVIEYRIKRLARADKLALVEAGSTRGFFIEESDYVG